METTPDSSDMNVSTVQLQNDEECKQKASLQECQRKRRLKCLQCSANVFELPENQNVTKTADCFFDSVSKGLNQIKVREEFSAKTLREMCHQFAKENDWVKSAVIDDARLKSCISDTVSDENLWNAYLSGISYTADDIEEMKDILENQDFCKANYGEILAVPIWGRPEIEGRIICERCSVKLHVIKKHHVNSEEAQIEEIIETLRTVSTNDIDGGKSAVHVLSNGGLHFEPVLSSVQFQHAIQQWFPNDDDDDDDSDNSQGQVKLNEGFINTVRSCFPEGEKVKRLEELLTDGADVNFKDANRNSNTPLHFAVKKGETEVVVFLIGNGANVNIKNNKNETPLSIAEQLERHDLIQLLELESSLTVGIKVLTEEKQNTKTFNKAKAAASAQLYNISLATLFLFKGQSDEIDSFCIASKMEDAANFGDIVLKYKYRNSNCPKILFLGVKGTDHIVTMKELLQDSGSDFELQKYFASYLCIKKQFSSELNKPHPIFSSKFNDCDFIIYTNTSSNFETGGAYIKKLDESIQEVGINCDAIFHFLEKDEALNVGHCYKLIYSKSENEVIDNLQYSADCYKLARELVQSCFQGVVDIIEPIIEKYHLPLVEKVLEMSGPKKGKFRHSFLNNDVSLSAQDKEFRKIFLQEAKKVFEVSEEKIKSELETKTMKIPSEFWITLDTERSEDVLSLPISVSDDDVRDFLNKLVIFVRQPNREKLRSVVRRSMQKVYNIDSEDVGSIFAEVELRVQDWYLKENYYLTKNNKIFQDAVRRSIHFDVKAPVSLFTGREKELVELHKALQSKDKTVMSQVASITGLDGVGKSELAKKYISEYSEEYDDNIIWINAETYCSIEESFHRLAQEKLGTDTKLTNGSNASVKVTVSQIYDYFAKKKRKSLFIFDNAKTLKEADEGIEQFLPSVSKIKPFVLITSHNQEWQNIKSLHLDLFTDAEATEFVKKALKIEGKVQEREIKELIRVLQNFPLALRQAVAFVEMTNKQIKSWSEKESVFTVSDYLRLYKEKGKEVSGSAQLQSRRSRGQNHDQLIETVFRTWTITLDKIQENQFGEEAVELLNVTAYLASGGIPAKMFLSELMSEEVLHGAAGLLDQYCIITPEHGKINVHRLVQNVTRVRLEEENAVQNVASLTLKLLKDCFPFACNRSEDYTKLEQLLPHVKVFLQHLDNWREKNPLCQRTVELSYISVVLNWIGSRFVEAGNPKKGKEFLERALSILDKHYGRKHFEVAKMLVKLSNVYGELGNPQKQKKLAEEALPVLEEHYGLEHTEVTTALESLGIAYDQLGAHKKQKDLLVRALIIRVNNLGYYHPSVVTTLLNLSTTFGKLGDPQRQLELINVALPIIAKYYGPEHFKVAIALENLGCAHGNLGDPQKQKELLERAIPVLEKHFGRQSDTVSTTLKNLAKAYAELGDNETSKKLLQEALTFMEKEFGSKHFKTATVLENLGLVYGALGYPQKHKELVEKALHTFKRHYGPDSPRVATALVNLSKAYARLGFSQKQKQLLEEAFPVLKQHYGDDHYIVAQVLILLGSVYDDLGNSHKAKELLKQALPILKRHFGPEHYEVASAICVLGCIYRTLGYPDKQLKKCKEALPIMQKHYGHNSPTVAMVLVNLSQAYAEFHDFMKQKELLKLALPIFESYYGYNHYEVARVQVILSGVFGNLGDPQMEKTILELALPVLEKHFGSEHYEVGIVLCNLGEAYGALGYPHEHEKLIKRGVRILKKHYGHEHFQVGLALESLGKAYGNFGDYNRQKELYEQALSILERHYGKNHYKVAMTFLDLATAYGNLNNPLKQMKLVCQALPILQKHYGPDHSVVGMALGTIGKAYGTLGDHYEQKEYLERSLHILENHYGYEHYNIAVTLEYLGAAYHHLGDHQKHKELLERALTITERSLGKNHFSVGVQLRSLSSAYGALGNHMKQRDLLERAIPILERNAGINSWKMATIFVDLANAYGALHDYKKQRAMLEKALFILEGHYGKDHVHVGEILMKLSLAYGALGDYLKQMELFERASLIFAKQFPKDFDQMCEIFFKLGILGLSAMADIQNEEKTAEFKQNDVLRPLHLATKFGDLYGVRILIEQGLDVNMCDNICLRTPLHIASESGYINIVNILLDNGANIEAGDVNNSKPLHYAAHNNHQEVVKILLKSGANVGAVDCYEKKPLDYTTSETVRMILKATSSLFDAVEEKHLEKVKNFVQVGGIINAVCDGSQLTVLHYAAHNSSSEVVQFLINKGARVNICDKDGWTPLHYAAQRGQKDIVLDLLNAGANADCRNNDSETPKFLAQKYGNSNVLHLLSRKYLPK